jgi:hypothetical protein
LVIVSALLFVVLGMMTMSLMTTRRSQEAGERNADVGIGLSLALEKLEDELARGQLLAPIAGVEANSLEYRPYRFSPEGRVLLGGDGVPQTVAPVRVEVQDGQLVRKTDGVVDGNLSNLSSITSFEVSRTVDRLLLVSLEAETREEMVRRVEVRIFLDDT